jgi:hypothetical protein
MESELVLPWFLALLAKVYGKEGQVEESLTVLADALDAVNKSGERCCKAELYRLRGELILIQIFTHDVQADASVRVSRTESP